jgi:hypothetical protein
MKEYLDAKEISISRAEKEVGLSNASLSKPFNSNASIKTDTLEKFLKTYRDINNEWLLTGRGNMLDIVRKEYQSNENVFSVSEEILLDYSSKSIILLQETLLAKDKLIDTYKELISTYEVKSKINEMQDRLDRLDKFKELIELKENLELEIAKTKVDLKKSKLV